MGVEDPGVDDIDQLKEKISAGRWNKSGILLKEMIMVIDDDESIRRLVQVILADEKLDTCLFSSAEVGLIGLDKMVLVGRLPGLILLDMRMKGMQGEEFARIIYGTIPEIPIVQFTAAVSRDSLPGVVATLAKPFNLDDLCWVTKNLARGGERCRPNP